MRPTGSATEARRADGSAPSHEDTSDANSTMPSVDAAERNSDTDTHDEGSLTRNATMHTASEFAVAFLRPATPATSDITTMTAARTADTGTPANTR